MTTVLEKSLKPAPFAVTAPRLLKLWGVTIDQVAYVTSTSFVGMFLGSIGAGALADRAGRRPALTFTVVFFGVFSLASVFSWDVVSLGVFRFLTSAGLAAYEREVERKSATRG